MSEIKPVYQSQTGGEWHDVTDKEYAFRRELSGVYKTRILYPAAAYEALKAENEAQAKRIAKLETPLNRHQILSACLSYRHDFGLLELEQQAALVSKAKSWEACFQKERDFAASKNGDSK